MRVLIADDHEVVRRGLKEVLREHWPNSVLEEARDANSAISKLACEKWDLLLLDINLPGRSGLEVLEEARRLTHRTPVLILTSYPEEQFALRAFKLGAAGYLTKNEASNELLRAVRRLLSGGKYVTPTLAERLANCLGDQDDGPPHETLSQRELQVLRLVAVGKAMKEIGQELGLSEKTIAVYRARIGAKTGLKTSVEIARYALKQGLVE